MMSCTAISSFTKTDTLKAKAIAVILMLFHHLFRKDIYINTYEISIPFFLDTEQLTRFGNDARVCVWIFVFLTAYGITIKLRNNQKNESVVSTLYKQWWALMKPYWFIYVVFFLLSFAWPQSAYSFHEGNWSHILTEFLGFAEFFEIDLWMGGWWYMCFAQILLFALPLLIIFVEKMSIFSIPLTYMAIQFISPGIKSTNGGYYSDYLYAVLIAILFVKYDLFGRFGKRPKGLLSIIEVVGLLFAFWLFADWKVALSKTEFSGIATLLSALSVVALCMFVQKYVTVKWIEKPLAYIGKHSGNIYLVHLAVYRYLPEIVFCTKTVLGSLAMLVGISLLISIALEVLKKLLRYDRILNALSNSILNFATGCYTKKAE